MSGEASTTPLPLYISVTSVTGLVGVNPRLHSTSVLASLRRQIAPKTQDPTTNEQTNTNKFVERDVYWALVGMIRDNYTQTTEQHIEAIKDYLGEEHSDLWYSKLYNAIRSTIGTVIHGEMGEQPKESLKCPILPNVILSGKPDIVEEDHIVELKTRKAFLEGIPEYEKVQIFCYMKLANKPRAILREVVKEETKDHSLEWDDVYWDRIVRTICVMIEWI